MRRIVMSICLWLVTSLAMAQQPSRIHPSGIQLNPGETLIAIDGVPISNNAPVINGVISASANGSTGGVTFAGGAGYQQSSNIAGNLGQSGQPFSHTPGSSALQKANHERRLQGQGPLQADPQLQQLALEKATIAARRGHKNHIGGSLGGASCEGVGHTAGRFLSCCLDKPGTYGGAAMVQGADGWYCCLLVR